MSNRVEIKNEKYVFKNRLFDAKLKHESTLRGIKDRQHEAYMHRYHLIDLLRLSKFTFQENARQKWENYKYTVSAKQFFLNNGLYIAILCVFIVLCIVTPIVKDKQLLTMKNILTQASPRMSLALGVGGLILLGGTDLSIGRMVGTSMVLSTMIMPAIGTFPTIILWAVAAIAVMYFIWNKTTFGKNMYAVGGNAEAADVSGISVFKVTIVTFAIAGILYGFGAWLECIRVVGGVSFKGGIGKIQGIVVGVLIFTALTYSLTILGVDTNLPFVFSGIIILAAVTIDCLKYVQKK